MPLQIWTTLQTSRYATLKNNLEEFFMFKRIMLVLTALLLMVSAASAAPTDEVKKAVDQVVSIVADKEMKKNEVKRRQALKKTISTIFE